jgi:FkbM family methyltransferase
MKTWKHIAIETLVSPDVIAQTEAFDLSMHCHTFDVRGKSIKWLAPNKRLLWMAAGIEYIEPELLDWIDQIPESSVYYDIGASNGIFAMYATKRRLKVVALEPDPGNYFLLSWNAYLNHGGDFNVSAFNVAASDEFSVENLYMRTIELGTHEKIVGAPLAMSGETFVPQHVHAIQLVPLDKWIAQFGLASPEYMKIDVDGHESRVLNGALDTLSRCKEVFIEIEDSKLGELSRTLGEVGLSMTSKYQVQNYKGLWNCIFSR